MHAFYPAIHHSHVFVIHHRSVSWMHIFLVLKKSVSINQDVLFLTCVLVFAKPSLAICSAPLLRDVSYLSILDYLLIIRDFV